MDLPEPVEPADEDCCKSDCVPCIFDVYKKQLDLWRKKQLRINHTDFSLLSGIKYSPFILKDKTQLTPDVVRLTFGAEQSKGGSLFYQAGQHFILRATLEETGLPSKSISRPYTPISSTGKDFDVAVKLYENGAMSKYIGELKKGDVTYWRGPYGDFTYEPNKYRQLTMVCIGTGIAPMFAISGEVLENEDDETRITLLYGCKSFDDIILRDELNGFTSYWNFSVTYHLSREKTAHRKKYSEKVVLGRLQHSYIIDSVSPYDLSHFILICGTERFNSEMKALLDEANIKNVHIFQ